MRRVFVGLVVSVVVVAGLPAVASAGFNEVEHPPIDCYGGNGFNSEFVSDVEWGFPCVAYDSYDAVGETDRTKRYTLWDSSQKLIAYFYGREDLGLSSGDECRFPDGTVTTDTWVIRGFWKTTVVCKAPPPPECSTTLPEGTIWALAWIDFVVDDVFTPGEDVWIAALVENGGGEGPSAGDLLLTNCYPTNMTPTSDDIAPFGTTQHTIDSIGTANESDLRGVASSVDFGFSDVDDFEWYYEGSASLAVASRWGDAIQFLGGIDFLEADPTSLSAPQTGIPVATAGSYVDDYFIDVLITLPPT